MDPPPLLLPVSTIPQAVNTLPLSVLELDLSKPSESSSIALAISDSILTIKAEPNVERDPSRPVLDTFHQHAPRLLKGVPADNLIKVQLGLSHSHSRVKLEFNVNLVSGQSARQQDAAIRPPAEVRGSVVGSISKRSERCSRLWATSGQVALELTKVLGISASATSTSIPKNLVLPEIGQSTTMPLLMRMRGTNSSSTVATRMVKIMSLINNTVFSAPTNGPDHW